MQSINLYRLIYLYFNLTRATATTVIKGMQLTGEREKTVEIEQHTTDNNDKYIQEAD